MRSLVLYWAAQTHLVVLVQIVVGHLSGLQHNLLLPILHVNLSVIGRGQVSLRPLHPIPDGGQAAPHHVLLLHHILPLPLHALELLDNGVIVAHLRHGFRWVLGWLSD